MTGERRYATGKIERGEDRPGCHMPLWGCLPLAGLLLLLLLLYGGYRLAIWIGFAASAGA